MYTHTHIYIYTHIHVYMYVYIYIYIYTSIYTVIASGLRRSATEHNNTHIREMLRA